MGAVPSLYLAGVGKRFPAARRGGAPVVALHDVSLSLAPGRLMALVGADASGKSTLLRICAGLIDADMGEVEVLGAPVARLDRGGIGYMPQGGALYEELSVLQNLELYGRLRGVLDAALADRCATLLGRTGLAAFSTRRVGQLSGGMRQKLALACAVVAAPPLLLLDEPSVGVDPVSRREIRMLARELAGPGCAVIWATALLDDAASCDDLVVLHEGEVRWTGVPQALSQRAAGRVWYQPVTGSDRRATLRGLARCKDVIAASPSGEGIRLVGRDGIVPGTAEGRWSACPPALEDGLVTVLDDGVPLGDSLLAEGFPLLTVLDGDAGRAPVIVASGLTRRYGAFTAANDISFAVRPGEIFGLLGPNGAGKSTTFRMLCGLVRPTAGVGAVAGHSLRSAATEARQAFGYMPQRFALYADLTVGANLRFLAGAYGLGKGRGHGGVGTVTSAIDWVVSALGLAPWWQTAAGLLPLGIRQRLSLAGAVLHKPPVLFLDEPTSGVDPLVRREFWHHINAIAARGVAVLVTTHFMDEAENCDHLLLINRAEAIAQGTPEELKRLATKRQAPDGNSAAVVTLEEAFIALVGRDDAPTAGAA